MILFAIDCSESMLALRDDPNYDDPSIQTCHIMTALDAAIQIQKKKVIVGPNDSVGIMFFNTVCSAVFSLTRPLTTSTDSQERRVGPRVRNQTRKLYLSAYFTYQCTKSTRTDATTGL